MRLTIIPSDHMVYVDGTALSVDCSAVADSAAPGAPVHAVQWNGSTGWIEYVRDPFDASPQANRTLADIAQFQPVIDAWTNAKAVADAAAAAAAAATPVVKP